jgi:hypothetical protein
MFRRAFYCAILITISLTLFCLHAGLISAQQLDRVASRHIHLRMPIERLSLGSDAIAEVEQCYLFMDRASGGVLPKKVLISADWNRSDNLCNPQNATILIGMNTPPASSDIKGYFLHNSAREIARLALLEISGGAQKEDTLFLFEGMIEILSREYERSTRSLEASWVISNYLREMNLLGLASQRSWLEFSSDSSPIRNTAPGVTFFTVFRNLQGRDKPIKLFQALKRNNLIDSLSMTFKAPAAELESIWIKAVKESQNVEEIVVSAEDAPQLIKTVLLPQNIESGTTLQLQLYMRDRKNNLNPSGVFIKDLRTGAVVQPKAASEKGGSFFVGSLPIDVHCPPGKYSYRVTAIDENGNLSRWNGSYIVESK